MSVQHRRRGRPRQICLGPIVSTIGSFCSVVALDSTINLATTVHAMPNNVVEKEYTVDGIDAASRDDDEILAAFKDESGNRFVQTDRIEDDLDLIVGALRGEHSIEKEWRESVASRRPRLFLLHCASSDLLLSKESFDSMISWASCAGYELRQYRLSNSDTLILALRRDQMQSSRCSLFNDHFQVDSSSPELLFPALARSIASSILDSLS